MKIKRVPEQMLQSNNQTSPLIKNQILKTKHRMIVCDIDGTLVPPETMGLDPRFLEFVKVAKQRKIALGLASGRHYDDMRNLVSTHADDFFFLASNGCVIWEHDRLIDQTLMEQPDPLEICREILSIEGAELLVSGITRLYARIISESFRDFILSADRGDSVEISDLTQIDQPIVKVSMIRREGVSEIATYFQERWGQAYEVAVSGDSWLDFTAGNKGIALEHICRIKQIDLSDVLVFGDNFNDIPMFTRAGQACAVAHADPEVQRHADYVTANTIDFLAEYFHPAD